jgi:glycosyltransferase involved in cell wall biosynthesis
MHEIGRGQRMKILFATLYDMNHIETRGIYEDLLRVFMQNSHEVFVVSPLERYKKEKTKLINCDGCTILKVRTGNIQKTNFMEKGVATLLLESQFISAIKRYFGNIKFDLVLYSTPPITLAGVIEYVKKRDDAKSYLLLKDIFPQNAVDIGMMSKTGIKGVLYKYFRKKEKKLYALSDYIGCMSQANVNYVLKHNPEIDAGRVEICPNSVEPIDRSVSGEEKILMRKKYGIPLDQTVFVYGGNLGKPQGIPFLIECLKSQKDNEEVFFLIVGGGTEYGKLEEYLNDSKQENVKLVPRLPKEDYDRMVGSCDVGMIFLDHRFTIPNFPSRLLSYMQAKLPVLAVTDPNTDIGKVIAEGGFGWWCESNSVIGFSDQISLICNAGIDEAGNNGFEFMCRNYGADSAYSVVLEKITQQ